MPESGMWKPPPRCYFAFIFFTPLFDPPILCSMIPKLPASDYCFESGMVVGLGATRAFVLVSWLSSLLLFYFGVLPI